MWLRILAFLVIAGFGTGTFADQPYTVKRGDTLSRLAKQFYGDVSGWRLIYRANRDRVFDGGDLVKVGTSLIIPDAPKGTNLGAGWRSSGNRAEGAIGRDSRVSMATPTTLLLDNRQAFVGTIVGASANSILIRRGVRTFRIALSQVKEARVDSLDGGVIAGELLDWRNGIFDLRANDYRLTVKGGQIISASLLAGASASGTPAHAISTRDVGIAEPPVIRLQNGKQIAGYVTKFDERYVTVQRGTRGSNRLRLTDIAEVQITALDGSTVSGNLVDWDDGIYRLQSDTRTIVAREGIVPDDPTLAQAAELEVEAVEVVAEIEPSPEPAAEPEGSDLQGAEAVSVQPVRTTTPPRAAPSSDVATASNQAGDQKTGDLGVGGDFIPISELVPEEGEAIDITVAALPVREDNGALRFEITLSRAPVERLVLVYASVDGTATSGVDYEKTSGVELFEPGQQSTHIDVPLIDDGEVEGDETVHLFISPDPSRAKVQERNVIGLVQDNDG